MAPRRDVKQFKQACREVGIAGKDEEQASDDFHAEKKASGESDHWPYRKLTNWLRKWREDKWRA